MSLRGKHLRPGIAIGTSLVLLLSSSAWVGAQAPGRSVYIADPPRKLLASMTQGLPQQFPPPSLCVAVFGLACYTPQLMRAAYNVPAAYTGLNQTIVIVDAYGSPTVREDLHVFSQEFGLPDADLEIVNPGGSPTFNPNQSHDQEGWAFETNLDVQWAHAIAPLAKIVLVVAANNAGNVLNNAQRYVIDHHLGEVMSLSFGADEAAIKGNNGNNLQIDQAHSNYLAARAAGITVFAAAGDGGATDGFSFPNALYPSSDPLVTSVGGTNLFMTDAGGYVGEIVWNDGVPAQCPFGCAFGVFGATGGAPSSRFAAPPFQQALTGSNARLTADVAYNGSVYTGVLVYAGFFSDPSQNGLYFVGGTSAGAPQWAAITALINQATGKIQGYFNPALYAIGANPVKYAQAFHDVTIGNNALDGPGFTAGTGYDLPTGLGTPNVAGLIAVLQQ
jgi:subtilase family serine protease